MARVDIKAKAEAALGRLAELRGRVRLSKGPGLSLAPLARLMAGLGQRLAALRSTTAMAAVAPAAVSAPLQAKPEGGRSLFRLDGLSLTRKVSLAVVVLGVALGAGQFVQSGADSRAEADTTVEPRDIVTLSASAVPTPAPRAVAAPDVETVALTDTAPAGSEDPGRVTTGSQPPVPVATGETTPAGETPAPPETAPPPAVAAAAPACDNTLTALPAPGAMIDLVLMAPCAAETSVVVQHAGLAVSARTSASGSLFLTLPALDAAGRVSLRLNDGTELAGEVPTDMTGIRRFAVQWQGDDRFQLHALEGDALFGGPGHVWSGAADVSGRLVPLGDGSVSMPLFAEVYTFPADAAQRVRLTVEAEVTGSTCARDILGETLVSEGGHTTVTDVTLSMPGCDAVGDFLVLNNLVPETTLASAAAD